MTWPDDFINKVICGDCLEVMKEIPDNSIDLVVTDPPYNASVRGGDLEGIFAKRRPGRDAGRREYGSWDYDYVPQKTVQQINRILSKNGQAYIFCSSHLLGEWLRVLPLYFDATMVIDWVKPDPVPSVRQRQWCSANEFIMWTRRGHYVFNYLEHGMMFSWQLYQAPKGNERVHPTQKPVKLIEKIIRVSSDKERIILDPFLGSGTTAVAAKRLGRKYIGIEINPDYCRIAEERLAQEELFVQEDKGEHYERYAN